MVTLSRRLLKLFADQATVPKWLTFTLAALRPSRRCYAYILDCAVFKRARDSLEISGNNGEALRIRFELSSWWLNVLKLFVRFVSLKGVPPRMKFAFSSRWRCLSSFSKCPVWIARGVCSVIAKLRVFVKEKSRPGIGGISFSWKIPELNIFENSRAFARTNIPFFTFLFAKFAFFFSINKSFFLFFFIDRSFSFDKVTTNVSFNASSRCCTRQSRQ